MEKESKHIVESLEVLRSPVPDEQYFKDLKISVLERTLPNKKQDAIVPLYKRWYSWGAAAVILFVAGFFYQSQNNQLIPKNESSFSELSTKEILDYFDMNPEYLDEQLLATQLPETIHWMDSTLVHKSIETSAKLSEQNEPVNFNIPRVDEIERQEILEYLQEEGYPLDEELFID